MKFSQSPGSILMIRPASFGLNPETAASNAFQADKLDEEESIVRERAKKEFDEVLVQLQRNDILVHVVKDNHEPKKTDAVFPNNWVSFQPDGKIIIYPMMSKARRIERRDDIIKEIQSQYAVSEVIDLTSFVKTNKFLEGTGSLVFDHANRKVYACRSPRTHEDVLNKLMGLLNYEVIIFDAVDENQVPIYHTNVLMSIGTNFAVICLDSIQKEADSERVLGSFGKTGHKVVAISYQQMKSFAGNMIEVVNKHGYLKVLLSDTAFESLLPGQINWITAFADMIPLSIPTIEKYGGGSVRCMVAGIHLPPKG